MFFGGTYVANNMRAGEYKTFVLHLDESAGSLLTSRLNDGYSALPYIRNSDLLMKDSCEI